jgi:hypothetical protein
MRGQVSAIYLFCLSLFGMGVGPTIVARFTYGYFADDMALGKPIAMTIAVTAPIAALLLWKARAAYQGALENVDFSGGCPLRKALESGQADVTPKTRNNMPDHL